MKKLYFFSAMLLIVLTGLQSCTKQSHDEIKTIPSDIMKASIFANETYTLKLDNSGSSAISSQASHALISQTEMDSKSGLMVYRYTPSINFIGTDQVVLAYTKAASNHSSGCSSNQHSGSSDVNYTTTYTTLTIDVISK